MLKLFEKCSFILISFFFLISLAFFFFISTTYFFGLVFFSCDTIALGNGKGCREAESFLNSLIKRKFFDPLKVRYTIVDEQGISIYSCSSLASEEFPGLDPNFISAGM